MSEITTEQAGVSASRGIRDESPEPSRILTINGGSSSLKFAVFERTDPFARLLSGRVDRIGLEGARWVLAQAGGGGGEDRRVDAPDQKAAVCLLIDWLERSGGFTEIVTIGHRIVHGGSRYHQPERVTAELIEELRGSARTTRITCRARST